MIGGFRNLLLGGEGLFIATLQGPGRVWLQTMPMEKLARKIGQFMPQVGSGRSGGLAQAWVNYSAPNRANSAVKSLHNQTLKWNSPLRAVGTCGHPRQSCGLGHHSAHDVGTFVRAMVLTSRRIRQA